jgi:hypothetical protein
LPTLGGPASTTLKPSRCHLLAEGGAGIVHGEHHALDLQAGVQGALHEQRRG